MDAAVPASNADAGTQFTEEYKDWAALKRAMMAACCHATGRAGETRVVPTTALKEFLFDFADEVSAALKSEEKCRKTAYLIMKHTGFVVRRPDRSRVPGSMALVWSPHLRRDRIWAANTAGVGFLPFPEEWAATGMRQSACAWSAYDNDFEETIAERVGQHISEAEVDALCSASGADPTAFTSERKKGPSTAAEMRLCARAMWNRGANRRLRIADVPIRICEGCGLVEHESLLKKCGKCKAVFYCSQECQRTRWSEHKQVCSTLAPG